MDIINAKIIKNSKVYDTHNMLLESNGSLAVLSAKSILSTEIMKILSPLAVTDWSPYKVCSNMMENIDLNQFIGITSSTLLEALLYNEFYKISLEINSYAKDDELDKVLDALRPTINSVLILLNKVK